MFPAAIMMPNWVPPALATSWTRLLFVSAMYTSPAPLTVTPAGPFSSADVAGPPSPVWPLVPVALPAKVEMIPDEATTFWTRLLPVSAMYRSPAPLSATPPGAFSSAAVAAPPSPDSPLTPAALPATVEIVPEAAATFWTRLLPVSAIYRSPPVLSVIPAGDFSSAAVAAPPSPEDPELPDALPATVEIVPDALAISWIRLLPVSAMYKFPAASTATPCGAASSASPAAPPSPLFPATPVADPAIVYTSPAIIAIPHWVPPVVAPAGPSPPAEGASACVAALTGAPSRTYGCPAAPSEAVKSAGVAAAS